MEFLDFKSYILQRFRQEIIDASESGSVNAQLLDEWCKIINKEMRDVGESGRGARGLIVNHILKEYDIYAFGLTPLYPKIEPEHQ